MKKLSEIMAMMTTNSPAESVTVSTTVVLSKNEQENPDQNDTI